MSKRVKKNLEQIVSKGAGCWDVALEGAKKELQELEERRSLLLEAIPVFEKLVEKQKQTTTVDS